MQAVSVDNLALVHRLRELVARRATREISEIIPGKLYQSGNLTRIREAMRSRGINVVVDLGGRLDPSVPTEPESICYVYWPMVDGPVPSNRTVLDELASFLSRLIQREQAVLVRCGAGFNRSGLLSALIVQRVLTVDAAEAIQLVRRGRPGALTNEKFVEFVLQAGDVL